MKTLIVYYSYGNNTRNIANIINKEIDADILEINPLKPFTTNYQQLVDEYERKMDDKEIIELNDININLEDYDRVILGTPVWWYHITPVLRSFLVKYDISKKKVYAFITNGGWLGESINDIKEYTNLSQYVNLEFDEDIIRKSSEERLNKFINDLKENDE